MNGDASRTGGRRLVVALYVVVVLLTALVGLIIGTINPRGLDPVLFGVVQLPPSPLGVAVYGGATVATLLGVVLVAVALVSKRYADSDG